MPICSSCSTTRGCLRRGLLRVHLLAVLVVPHSWRWGAVAAAFTRANTEKISPSHHFSFVDCGLFIPHDFAVDGAGDAVLKLEIHFGYRVFGEDRGIGDITCTALHQYASLSCSLGVDVRIAADSTMLRIVNLLIALSFGVQREQLEHRIGFTCPRPFLFRPLRGCQYTEM